MKEGGKRKSSDMDGVLDLVLCFFLLLVLLWEMIN